MTLPETLIRLARTRGEPTAEEPQEVRVDIGTVTVTWPQGDVTIKVTTKTLSSRAHAEDTGRLLRGEEAAHHVIESVEVSSHRNLRSSHRAAAVLQARDVLTDERAVLLLAPRPDQEGRMRRLDLAEELLAGPRPRTLQEDLVDAERVAPAPLLWKQILEAKGA